MVIPEEKKAELEQAYKQIGKSQKQYRKGIITDGERYNKVVDIWTHAGDKIADGALPHHRVQRRQEQANPLFMMVDSGARGNRSRSSSSPACAA